MLLSLECAPHCIKLLQAGAVLEEGSIVSACNVQLSFLAHK